MNVPLTPDCEELIQKKVESGLYLSAGEVIREALHLLDERDRFHEFQLEDLRKAIQIGLDQADRGEIVDGPLAFEKIREKLQARTSQVS